MKTVKFYKDGNIIKVMDYNDDQVMDSLPPAVYTLNENPFGFYLTYVTDSFEVPAKLYGSTSHRAEKVLKTYDSRSCSTGVLMTGDKGSGKTMLSSLLCNSMIKRGLPVILIENAFEGTGFINLLTNIGECVLFFDEFVKVFKRGNHQLDDENTAQDGLLSLFDGTHSVKRLILLTENETYGINSFMLNRPGRIFYHFKYKKLEESLVREYCEANEIPEDITKAILLRIESSREFSFDVLKAVVEEYKRFGEDIQEIFSNLNIEEEKEYYNKMKVVKVINLLTDKECETSTIEVAHPENGGNDEG